MALRVRDVMTGDPETVSPTQPCIEAAERIIEKRYSGIPVADEDGVLVGLVEVEDLLPRPSQVPFTRVPVLEFQGEWVDENDLDKFYDALRSMSVERVMRQDLPTVGPDEPLGAALVLLVKNQYRRLLVIDENEELLGVVTRTDLLRVLSEGS